MDTFRFRLNCLDNYQATPTDLDPILRRGAGPSQKSREASPQVPVIRAFGATETGQKVCAHIHGALPYLYLEYTGSLEKDAVNVYLQSLRASIDHALALTYRRNAYDGKSVYVGHISLVKGVPFFGYNVGYKTFLKVYMLNPMHMTRFVDLLHQGAILNRIFQPYESHLQYLLQWMCDYNLFGCDYINCAKVQFRGPVPDSDEIDTKTHKWHDASVPEAFITEDDQYPRQSHCTLEVDICVQDILNRYELQYRPIHHDFLERSSQMPRNPDDKFVPSMAGLWRDETRRRKRQMGLTDTESSPFPAEVMVSMSADPRNTDKGGWIHEEEYRELVANLIEEEKKYKDEVSFGTFVKEVPGQEKIRTTVESVEDLYPENLSSQQIDDYEQEQAPEPEPLGAEVKSTMTLVNALPCGDEPPRSVEQLPDAIVKAVEADEAGQDDQSDTEEHQSLDPLTVSLLRQSGDGETSDDHFDEGIDLVDPSDAGSIGDPNSPSAVRKRNFEPEFESPQKRQRVLNSSPLTARKIFFSERLERRTTTSTPRKNIHDEPRPSQSSQTSIKAQGHGGLTTMSFPVVKNSNDPRTKLRLSQAGYSNSQDLPKTPGSKHLMVRGTLMTPLTPWTHQKTSPVRPNSSGSQAVAEASSLTERLAKSFPHQNPTLYFGTVPPSFDMVNDTMMHAGLPPVIFQDAYYSNEKDVPDRAREYAGREFKLQSTTLPYLPPFDPTGKSAANFGEQKPILVDKKKEQAKSRIRSQRCSLRNWEIAKPPPPLEEVEEWLENETTKNAPSKTPSKRKKAETPKPRKVKFLDHLSQIEGPTQKNKHGFKFSQKQKSTSVKHETQYMSIMSLEVHVNSRGDFVPDPAEDEIQCIFWTVEGEENATTDRPRTGVLCLSEENGIAERIAKQVSVEVEYEEDELDLINRIVDIVWQFDPDILTGYEVHNSSWGYLIERARMKFEYNLCDEISRVKSQSHGRFGKDADRWGFTQTSTIRVTGRHMINIWRAMRGELNLLQYTMENVVFHLLHKRIPHYQHSDLTSWYLSTKPRDLSKVLNHFLSRIQLNLDILQANEVVPRTSEQARLLGVDFFSVISRGSQFKVESTMFRIAKPENFVLISPSRKQVGQQNALECLPLVMEPQSAFYSSPLLVLDFQSLYPSVMIAYNLCYSTCLGRITSWRGRNKMGFIDFKREPRLLELVKDNINITPNGMMYVKPEMRKSLLAKMLGEILETRVMVKSGMKQDKDDKPLQQLLNNRQLALKLLANVTYGYTSASFSGRMPCSEIADSIVQTGRETLEKAIALIHATEKWGAEVVYGDTDSLFIYLKGRTRDQAFTIGEEIAKAITDANPRPIKLKFEKVYHPCVLLAKKRYVGFKYEHRNQTEPEFDAKGIETVRRDGTPAEQKIEERALKILFRTADLSQVKSYFQEQCAKIMQGRISIQDFLFAKEVKLGTYSDRGPPPPGALIATKRMLADPRTEPQYGERVPYVVITGAPGARLIDRCVAPEVLLANDHLELDAEYYISKNLIPPLERIFNLVGANVRQWYDEMPKVQRMRNITVPLPNKSNPNIAGGQTNLKKTLESYMKSSSCLVCRAKLPPPPTYLPGVEPDAFAVLPLCAQCLRRPARALLTLKERIWKNEVICKEVDMVCRSCSGLAWGEEIKCDSRDCPVFYTRIREKSRLSNLREGVGRVVNVLEDGIPEEFGEKKGRRKGKGKGKGKKSRGSEGLAW
ncbi:DNA polymeras-like protein zeta catalytic subunit [Macroventuria anomochaeta]|uniref:DNA polymeras-like protein zeta catalytic subunit n=1 Tax=Macroventuria anomochaeta TaxID=301207 RepID=A0ACB6SGC8_9PLEO|nr:DNA polymeras-like protein zeta catalytic subunit [Macroventuria anomochaeta]KAF2632532.1 DNA polymeras-like protein zeta catalytic subunit [Macroventuria anomochaeta]